MILMMNYLNPQLLQIGYYISPEGGASAPAVVRKNLLFWEVLTKGRVRHPETNQWCEPGTVFAHRPGQSTIYQAPEGMVYECVTLSFRLEEGASLIKEIPRDFFWSDPGEVKVFTQDILNAAHREKMDLQVLGNYVWSTLMFKRDRARRQDPLPSLPPEITKVMRMLSSDPGREWSLEDVAREVGWSRSHLHAEFKQATQTTPHQYLIRERMAEARHQLVKSQTSIKEVAYNVGFKSTENFCRLFKKVHQQTAGDFRARHQDSIRQM